MATNTDIVNNTQSNINWYDNDDGPSLTTRIIFASIWVFIAVAGITGNSLVIFIATHYEKLSNVTNCFIVNLAITDIVFLVFCMPLLVVQYTLDHWYFNQTFCKLLNCTSFVSVLVTVLTLVVMTIDRYIYITNPFEDIKWRKPKTVFLLSLIIWLLSCMLASPFYAHYGVIVNGNYKQCVLLSDEYLQKRFRIYTVTLYYFIPLTIIIICYTGLLHFVYSKENKCVPKTRHNRVKWSKRRRAVTKMVAIVTLAFSLCWLPITLFLLSANFFEDRTAFLYYFKMIANSFAYLNSAINPVLYAFLNRSFRNNCENIFSKPSFSFLWCRFDYGQEPVSRKRNCTRMSENRFSEKEKNITVDNNNELLPNDLDNNDFSDSEYEPQDFPIDRFSECNTNNRTHHKGYMSKPCGHLPMNTTTTQDRHLTTTL